MALFEECKDGLTLENVSDRYFCKLTDQREKINRRGKEPFDKIQYSL